MARNVFDGGDLNAGAMDELAALPDGQPFALINLLLYKEWADYPPGTVSEKLTGKQAYERYTELAIPLGERGRRRADVAGCAGRQPDRTRRRALGRAADHAVSEPRRFRAHARQSRLSGDALSPDGGRQRFALVRCDLARSHRADEVEAFQSVAKAARRLSSRASEQQAQHDRAARIFWGHAFFGVRSFPVPCALGKSGE